MQHSVYDFQAKTIDGTEQSLSEYNDKVLLIVNTASQCGFTPQYEGLEKLYQQFKDRGFVVLGFPCNQFQNQEPGDEKEIQQFCSLNFGVTFPMFSKIQVNGSEAHPLYRYLVEAQKGLFGSKAIKWNFTKFLIDRKGQPVKRYAPATKPSKIASDIESLLQ